MKQYYIEKWLNECDDWGSVSQLAKHMGLHRASIYDYIKYKPYVRKGIESKKNYTKHFNECFETSFTPKELFELVEK